MSIELEPDHRRLVDELVSSGRFPSENAVVSEAMELIRARELRLSELDEVLERSVAASKAGRTKPAEEVFDRLEAKYRAIAEQR